jgi:hypothetical protein
MVERIAIGCPVAIVSVGGKPFVLQLILASVRYSLALWQVA